MEITKEELLKRKQALINDYNAIGGAIQDVDFWLNFLEREGGQPSPQDVKEDLDGNK